MYSMAGIIKRNNKWVAVFRTLDGKEIRKTTRVDVVPKVIPPGVNKRALLSQNEARARLIAEELENGHKTGFVDSNRLKAIAGGRYPVIQPWEKGGECWRLFEGMAAIKIV